MPNKKYNPNWYKKFFSKYYLPFLGCKKSYLDTKKEIDFICRSLNLPKGAAVLDLACGFGRHAIELAQKGFRVTGLDFTKNFLQIAQKEAKKRKLSLPLIQSDMRHIPFENKFDAVINMFSSFAYFREEKENFKVIKVVFKALRPGGVFLLDLPNKNWMLTKINKKTWQKINNIYVLEERFFNNNKKIYLNNITIIRPGRKTEQINTFFRIYDLFEMRKKLKRVKFKLVKVYGNYKGQKFDHLISPRMIIIAKKPKNKKI